MKKQFLLILCRSFLTCSWLSATFIAYWKQLPLLFFLVHSFPLLICLGESMFDPPQLRFFLVAYMMYSLDIMKLLTFINCYRFIWCLCKNESKISCMTSSVSLPIIIAVVTLRKYRTYSPLSAHEINLVLIARLLPDFSKSSVISHKCSLIF